MVPSIDRGNRASAADCACLNQSFLEILKLALASMPEHHPTAAESRVYEAEKTNCPKNGDAQRVLDFWFQTPEGTFKEKLWSIFVAEKDRIIP